MSKAKTDKAEAADMKNEVSEFVGVAMPISEIDGCSAKHWSDVREIIYEAITAAGCKGRLVSDSDTADVIQKSIVENLNRDDIVVFDVSGRNANVFYELGLRVAFDKAAIIVKDDSTPYSFDTSPVRHVGYRRDLRYAEVVRFKKELAEKILATHALIKKGNYSPFMQAFGPFKVPKIATEEVPVNEYILQELTSINNELQALRNGFSNQVTRTRRFCTYRIVLHAPATHQQLIDLQAVMKDTTVTIRDESTLDVESHLDRTEIAKYMMACGLQIHQMRRTSDRIQLTKDLATIEVQVPGGEGA